MRGFRGIRVEMIIVNRALDGCLDVKYEDLGR